MSISTVVTRGFGSFGTIPFVVTAGYSIGAAIIILPCNVNFFGILKDTLSFSNAMTAQPTFKNEIKDTLNFEDGITDIRNFKGDIC